MDKDSNESVLHVYCDESKPHGRYILGVLIVHEQRIADDLLDRLNAFGKQDRTFSYHARNDLAQGSSSQRTANAFLSFIREEFIYGNNRFAFAFERLQHKSEREAYLSLRDRMAKQARDGKSKVLVHRDRGTLSTPTQKLMPSFKEAGVEIFQYEKNKPTLESRLISVVDFVLYDQLRWPSPEKAKK